MKDCNDFLQYLYGYCSFLARDLFSKALPGAVAIYPLLPGDPTYSPSVSQWITLLLFGWATGWLLQAIKEIIDVSGFSKVVECVCSCMNKKDCGKISSMINFFKKTSPNDIDFYLQARKQRERYVIIKEFAGNFSISVVIAGYSYLWKFGFLEDFGKEQKNLTAISPLIAFFILYFYSTITEKRQDIFEKIMNNNYPSPKKE